MDDVPQPTKHDVEGWVAKHRTEGELRWALTVGNAAIKSLLHPDSVDDPYELAVWRARMPLLKAKALLLGVSLS